MTPNATDSYSPSEALASILDREWRTSRSGAVSGRGYHYQDAVGSWLAIRVHIGDLVCDQIVPEGLEDLSCEGGLAWQVQVKSRQARVGDFKEAEAAAHILASWQRHQARHDRGEKSMLAIVFERPIAGSASNIWGLSIGSSPTWEALVRQLQISARRRDIVQASVDLLLERVSVVVLPQSELEAQAVAMVHGAVGLPLLACTVVVRALRAEVAKCVDTNAQVEREHRAGLTRTEISRVVSETAALVDRAALQEAIASGACEAVDFDRPLNDASFYEGRSVQPGHVSAGLVVARAQFTDAVLKGLDDRRPTLVAGPSGIGKSAVLWMAAYVARHITWYRVARLREEDIEPLIRLARASGAGRFASIGFVVDGVGVGALVAWDSLAEAVSREAGVLLLGSVRSEEVTTLATLADCEVVHPQLDENLAARIYDALSVRGACTQPHWQESYDQARGLTLEYTFLLTRGKRLQDVLAQQVRTRIRERRDFELMVLAPVALADQWSVPLDVQRLINSLKCSAPDLRSALSRLVDEHLVAVDGAYVSGLHPLRSAAICRAVHEVPPPVLEATARIVVGATTHEHFRALLPGMLGDHPELAAAVIDELLRATNGSGAQKLGAPADERAMELAEALHGLRATDFVRSARRWQGALTKHSVPPVLQALTLFLLLQDGELLEAFAPSMLSALTDLRNDPEREASPLRDDLVRRLEPSRIGTELGASRSAQQVVNLLSSLAGTNLLIELEPQHRRHLAALLACLRTDELSTVIQAGAAVSPSLGAQLVELAGGAAAILQRLRVLDPWLLELGVVREDGKVILRGRRLYVSERVTPSIDEGVRSIALLGLGCLPDVDQADIYTVWAGNVRTSIGSYEVGRTGRIRSSIYGPSIVAWNRKRAQMAVALVAAESSTSWLAAGLHMLRRVSAFLADLGETWVLTRNKASDVERVNRQRADIMQDATKLKPAPATSEDAALRTDPFYSVVQNLVDNLPPRLANESQYTALVGFTGDIIPKTIRHLKEQRWALLGLDDAPQELSSIETRVASIHAVLAELRTGPKAAEAVVTAARRAKAGKALAAAAVQATRRAEQRFQIMLSDLRSQATLAGASIECMSAADPDSRAWPKRRVAVVLHVDTLFELEAARSKLPVHVSDPFGSPARTLLTARKGRVLPRLSATLSASGEIVVDPLAATPWLAQCKVQSTPLADAVLDCHHALEELSGIAYFCKESAEVDATGSAASEAVGRWNAARSVIAAMGTDSVVELLLGFLDRIQVRVKAELAGTANRPPYVRGLVGDGVDMNEESNTFGLMTLLAMEWDIEPDGARAWLARIGDGTDESVADGDAVSRKQSE